MYVCVCDVCIYVCVCLYAMSVTRGQETRRGHMRRREWKLIKKGVLGGTYTKCVTSRQKGGHWVREAAGIWGGGEQVGG